MERTVIDGIDFLYSDEGDHARSILLVHGHKQRNNVCEIADCATSISSMKPEASSPKLVPVRYMMIKRKCESRL